MSISNVIDEALEMEVMSRDAYRRLSKGSMEAYAGQALAHLADQEQRHILILESFRSSLGGTTTVALPQAGEFAQTWDGYVAAIEDVKQAVRPHSEEVTVLQKGIELEQRSHDLYVGANAQADTDNGKAVFAFLAEQELHHRKYLERLLNKVLSLTEEPPEARPRL